MLDSIGDGVVVADERIHRRAVRRLLQDWKLYKESQEVRKGAESADRTGGLDVAIST